MISDRLALSSQRMALVTLWFIVAMLLLNAACWVWPAVYAIKTGYGIGVGLTDGLISGLNLDIWALAWWQKLGGILLSSTPLLTLATGLWHLRSLFQCYARREYFSPTTATYLERVGKWVTLWVVLSMLCEPLLSVWSTISEPVGHRVLTLSFGSPYLVALFLAACIAIIARILRQASELDAEHRQFV